MSDHIVWQDPIIKRSEREDLRGHKGALIWLTGLSGAGKSSLGRTLDAVLCHLGCHSFLLDGDNIRHGLCADLGFSENDRAENIRRIGEVAKLFVESGQIVITAFISPFRADRDKVRQLTSNDFVEVYCDCPISVCEARDPKGLYKKAREGIVSDFTGISSPYESPLHPELVLDTSVLTVSQCVEFILNYLVDREILSNTHIDNTIVQNSLSITK